MQEIIRYLTEQERVFTRSLYEECFPEDSQEFVDYYYQNKIRDNQILIMEEPGNRVAGSEGWPQAMLHLNPFLFRFGRECCRLNYIVAVAAAPAVRKQGKMFRCMARALKDMAAQGQPFTFLIPANPRVYESSGFAFVPGNEAGTGAGGSPVPEQGKGSGGRETDVLYVEPAREAESLALAEFSNGLLAGQYQVFPLRDREYMERLRRELRAQEGALLTARDQDGSLVGVVAYGREGAKGELQHILAAPEHQTGVLKAVRAYLLKEGIRQVEEAGMPFMVRILDLPRMMELLGGVCVRPFRLRVRVTDQLIRKNNGCFELYCQKGRGGLREISGEAVECELDAAGLAERLFGSFGMYIREWV